MATCGVSLFAKSAFPWSVNADRLWSSGLVCVLRPVSSPEHECYRDRDRSPLHGLLCVSWTRSILDRRPAVRTTYARIHRLFRTRKVVRPTRPKQSSSTPRALSTSASSSMRSSRSGLVTGMYGPPRDWKGKAGARRRSRSRHCRHSLQSQACGQPARRSSAHAKTHTRLNPAHHNLQAADFLIKGFIFPAARSAAAQLSLRPERATLYPAAIPFLASPSELCRSSNSRKNARQSFPRSRYRCRHLHPDPR